MNRDNALFMLMGLVLGFVLAYPVFETMSKRQPALRQPGAGVAGTAGAAAAGGAGGPAVEQIRQLRAYVEANPTDAQAVLALANLNLQIQDRIRARTLYEQYLELQPDDRQAMLILANLYFDTQEFSRARELYETHLEGDPDNPDVITDLGVCYRNMGEPERALEFFLRAQELQPGHWISLYNQAVVLAFDLARYDAAQEVVTQLESLQPGNANVANLAAEIERRRNAA